METTSPYVGLIERLDVGSILQWTVITIRVEEHSLMQYFKKKV
jgi:hypothetical protein